MFVVWDFIYLFFFCLLWEKILFDKCSCILIKLRNAPEFMSVGASVFYSSVRAAAAARHCCHLLKLLPGYIYRECKHMLAQVGSGAITQEMSSDCATGHLETFCYKDISPGRENIQRELCGGRRLREAARVRGI